MADHVFISYAREDQDYARKLENDLRKRGFKVWIDDRLGSGDRWWQEIDRAIRACAAFVVVMTPNAGASNWVRKEIMWAIKQRKPILPLLLRGAEFSELIDIHHIDVTDGRMPPQRFYDRLPRHAPRKRETPQSKPKVAKPKVSQKPSSPSVMPALRYDGFYRRKLTLTVPKALKEMMTVPITNEFFHFLAFHEDRTVRLDSALRDDPSIITTADPPDLDLALEALLENMPQTELIEYMPKTRFIENMSQTQHTVFPQDDLKSFYPKIGLLSLSTYTVQGKDIEFSFVYYEEEPLGKPLAEYEFFLELEKTVRECREHYKGKVEKDSLEFDITYDSRGRDVNLPTFGQSVKFEFVEWPDVKDWWIRWRTYHEQVLKNSWGLHR